MAYVLRHCTDGSIASEFVDKPIVHPLIAIEGKQHYFDGIAFVNDSSDQHTVYYQFKYGERQGETFTVTMRRQYLLATWTPRTLRMPATC